MLFHHCFRLSLLFLLVCGQVLAADVHLGPRPFFLVDSMSEGPLKQRLEACKSGPFKSSAFSIGHRGAPLQFPEHTRESYLAAARMGAGALECDVTFTKDRELVCRHSQCDLHTTTNILAVPELAATCRQPFVAAKLDKITGEVLTPASAECCTSDITVDEFLSLKGKMDAANRSAQTVAEYLDGTSRFRTDLYAANGTLLTHRQSIALFQSLNVEMTPELKSPKVTMPFQGDYTQEDYAEQLIKDYVAAGVAPSKVRVQSFNLEDVQFWIEHFPEFGEQAIFLDGRYTSGNFDPADEASWQPTMAELKNRGVNFLAPPLWVLLQASSDHKIVPSAYAVAAKTAGLDLITWTLERSGSLTSGGGWYYQTVSDLINNEGDVYQALDVLAQEVGVTGVFSDWPATVTYYASCSGL